MKALEHDADALAAETGQPVLVERLDPGAVDRHGTALGALEASQNAEQRGFPRPRRSRQADGLTAPDLEIDALQDMDSGRRTAQTHMDIVERDRSLNHHPPFRTTDVPNPPRSPYGFAEPRCQLAALALVVAIWVSGMSPAFARTLKIVAFGDSLTAGYELPADAAFPSVLERALHKDGFDVTVANAGVSGDTSSGGLDRLDWSVPDGTDLTIVELGANDMLRGIDPAVTRTALDGIVSGLVKRGSKVLLDRHVRFAEASIRRYREQFAAIYPGLAKRYDVPLYPFFLAGIIGKPELHLADGLHPNAAGVDVLVANILPTVEDVLRGMGGQRVSRAFA